MFVCGSVHMCVGKRVCLCLGVGTCVSVSVKVVMMA